MTYNSNDRDKEIANIFDAWFLSHPKEQGYLVEWLKIIEKSIPKAGPQTAKVILTYTLLYKDKPETRIGKLAVLIPQEKG